MSASKLFTPSLRSPQATPIRRSEGAVTFMNPPTHPEIPVYFGPTDTGEPQRPLSLCKDKGTSTTHVTRRPVSAKSERGNY